ncbi:MAG TPA: enoyl-CoA hydratase-related protein [Candidatus Dormibacteraeota bacterium]|nr:enoyl-CoA hydratase-related protein [Candidatus Dormibacteraeota bacterium]
MAVPKLEAVLVALEPGVATITLNQPEKRNPLSGPMVRDLLAALAWARDEPAARVLVLTGAGDRVFCAGADLGSSFDADSSELDRHHERRGIALLFTALRDLGKPVLGRINGHALAGGFGLACACDLLLAVESAQFGTPEINVGVWPMMISAVLVRNLPRKVVLEMMLLGDRWSAEQMREAGLVSRVAADLDELDRLTAEMARALAKKSPAILRLGRDAFYRSEDMSLDDALAFLHSQLTLVTLSEDTREGIRAFFEKREPEFKGR